MNILSYSILSKFRCHVIGVSYTEIKEKNKQCVTSDQAPE